MSRIRRIAPGLGRGGLLGNTEGPEAYLRELDTLPSQFCRATGGTETVISQGGKFYRVNTFTDTDPTSLLLNFDGANGSTTFTDDSGWGHAVTANGDSQISTTESKFGGSSAYFDGNNDWLTVGSQAALSFGTDDFTIEFWARLTDSSAIQIIFDARNASSANPWQLWIDLSEKINFRHGASVLTSSNSITYGQWQHYAVTRSSGTIRLFLDGVADANTATNTSAINAGSANLFIGRLFDSASLFLNGYIDSLRITKGQALYTAAFTPPTTALTRVGSGSLTFTRGGAVEYLVVGGGGGGGSVSGGGGGAGGFRSGVLLPLTAGSDHQIAVGAGGSGAASRATRGFNGSNSVFSSVSSAGGGGGGSGGDSGTTLRNGQSGGSGGGGSYSFVSPNVFLGSAGTGNTPSVSPSQGNDGGASTSTAGTVGGGGGGGASQVGGSGTNTVGGGGGNGTASTISGTSTTYSGGGGGGAGAGGAGTAGSGGDGGGGAGTSDPTTAASGTASTGGGGGGGGYGPTDGPGGSGGSGIVIARYRITQAEYEAEAA